MYNTAGEGGGALRQERAPNAARSKFLQGTSARFSFFITRGLKIETRLDRDPEIDRGHHSYKKGTPFKSTVCARCEGAAATAPRRLETFIFAAFYSALAAARGRSRCSHDSSRHETTHSRTCSSL